ncbi:MAG: DUF5309 family protein [Patescibacteria group bacterium]|nr:DUF5309 family protein [Patescibacteria group bacterium]
MHKLISNHSRRLLAQATIGLLIVLAVELLIAAMTGHGLAAGWHYFLATAPLGLAGMGSITVAPNLSQASSAYRNLQYEDLMDVLDLFDPAATPAFTLAKTEQKLDDVTTTWEVDKYESPQGAVGPGDGYALQDSEKSDVTATRRKMGNGGQLFREGFGSGYIAERVPRLPGSGKGILASALRKYMIRIKQDIEVAFTSFDQTYAADAGGANGGVMAGLRKLIDPANKYPDANSMTFGKPSDIHAAPAGACVTGALADNWNLSLVKTMLSALFDNVQRDREYWLLANKGLRQAVSALTDPQAIGGGANNSTPSQQRIFTREQDDETFKQKISVIQTDFGTLLVKLTSLMGTTMNDVNGNYTATRADRVFTNMPNYGYIIPAEKLAKRWGFPIDTDELGHDGGGLTRMIFTYLTLVAYNPQGFGFLALT